jgi:hypothetical protein
MKWKNDDSSSTLMPDRSDLSSCSPKVGSTIVSNLFGDFLVSSKFLGDYLVEGPSDLVLVCTFVDRRVNALDSSVLIKVLGSICSARLNATSSEDLAL